MSMVASPLSRSTAPSRGEPLCGRHQRGPWPACSVSRRRSLPATGMPAATPRTAAPPSSAPICSFGQISPVEMALAAIAAAPAGDVDRASFLEELIVRRELAHNFVWYRPDYDSYACLPRWARASLGQHADDPRATPLRRAGPRGRAHPRPLLQRRDARDAADGLHAQLHADVLGQEDPGMVAEPRGRPTPRR